MKLRIVNNKMNLLLKTFWANGFKYKAISISKEGQINKRKYLTQEQKKEMMF